MLEPTTHSAIQGGFCEGCRTFTAVAYCPLRSTLSVATFQLCDLCWDREMDYRREQNKRLPAWAQSPVVAWPGDAE